MLRFNLIQTDSSTCTPRYVRKVKKLFQTIDASGDGAISLEEFAKLVQSGTKRNQEEPEGNRRYAIGTATLGVLVRRDPIPAPLRSPKLQFWMSQLDARQTSHLVRICAVDTLCRTIRETETKLCRGHVNYQSHTIFAQQIF